jgi:anthranilate phosphoribosyltransferase
VLTALGVKLDVPPEKIANAISGAGVGFMWAPMHHPAMKHWAPVRAELGIRTLFNLLGPLSNPAGVKRQVVGVFDQGWVEPLAEVLKNLGSVHAWVVHGRDGLDELTTTGTTRVAELKDGDISVFDVTPDLAGLPTATLADLKGGDASVNAIAIQDVLKGTRGPFRDIVLMNAAAALVVADKAASLADGVERAARAIDTGRAAQALDKLIAITNEGG